MRIEEDGQASLLRDLLELGRTYTYQRYRIDVLGFLAAWIMVAAFIVFYYWMSKW